MCKISLAVSVPLNINVQIQSCDGKVICDLYEGFVGKDLLFKLGKGLITMAIMFLMANILS